MTEGSVGAPIDPMVPDQTGAEEESSSEWTETGTMPITGVSDAAFKAEFLAANPKPSEVSRLEMKVLGPEKYEFRWSDAETN